MVRFSEGDRVRVDIPDETDPDHEDYHGKHGTVAALLEDDAAAVTGNAEDSILLRIEFDSGMAVDLRARDLRPPLE